MLGDLVIGSGPAGVAAATALLARGRHVTMIDGGATLGADHVRARDALAARPSAEWRDADRQSWQQPQYETSAGQVRRFGSDFAMQPAAATFADGEAELLLRSSHAAGGLSNLWGSAVLPYSAGDMAGWPITSDDLAPHYQAVAAFMPVAGRADDLADLFPSLPMADRTPLPPTAQGQTLLARLAGARAPLAEHGITCGQARQAVAPGCRACGQCLHGCPWQLIWSANQHLAELRRHPRFSYRPGAIAHRFAEGADSVTITLASGETLLAERSFIAAGVLESARILLASLPGRESLTLKDSQHGFLPMLHRWRSPNPEKGPYHTLTQAFAELANPAVSPFLVHAQLYGWNEFYARDLIASYGRRLPGSAPVWRALARRLIVAQIFLHSDHSAQASLTLAPDGRLIAKVAQNPKTGAVFDAAVQSLAGGMRHAGLHPLTFARRLNPAGSSFHAGGTLPMSEHGGAGRTDILGRPHGLQRVHVVDASVFPTIPATTITFPVMANAHRIAANAP